MEGRSKREEGAVWRKTHGMSEMKRVHALMSMNVLVRFRFFVCTSATFGPPVMLEGRS